MLMLTNVSKLKIVKSCPILQIDQTYNKKSKKCYNSIVQDRLMQTFVIVCVKLLLMCFEWIQEA